MYLLSTDLHLDDNPDNEYRWEIFAKIDRIKQQFPVSHVFLLGDIPDRKDRYSAAFVNRLISELNGIAPVTMLRGNHDTTFRPPSFFRFLTESLTRPKSATVDYIDEITEFSRDLLLLPFSAQPKKDWADIRFEDYKAVFMHATVTGAKTENGQIMENANFPALPRSVKFYSGDVHVPQQIRNITYVGCPHPIKYGDDYPCRVLLLNEETFSIQMEMELVPKRRLMLNLTKLDDLDKLLVKEDDQAKVRITLPVSSLQNYGEIEAKINDWVKRKGVKLASLEITVESFQSEGGTNNLVPQDVLSTFAKQEGINEEMTKMGIGLLKEAMECDK